MEFNDNVVNTIADKGIMIVLCSVIVVFLVVSLKLFLDLQKKVNDSIIPEIESIKTELLTSNGNIATSLTSHNTNVNNKLVKMSDMLTTVKNNEININKLIEEDRLLNSANKNLLRDVRLSCPAVHSKEHLIKMLIVKGICTQDQIDDILSELEDAAN